MYASTAPHSPHFTAMETRGKKRLQREAKSRQRDIIRTSILERDKKVLTDLEKKNLWLGKNCLNCERIRQLLDICAICRSPMSVDNLFIPACQHTFCRTCLLNYLDKTSTKYATVSYDNSSSETFRCPTCRIRVFNVNRHVHLKKNHLYSGICQVLGIRNEI